MVGFVCINDRNNAWKNRFNLKGSAYILAEDFPPLIQSKHKKLEPFFKAARKHRSIHNCELHGDVLIIEGKKIHRGYS